MLYLHIEDARDTNPWSTLAALTESGPGFHEVEVLADIPNGPPKGIYIVLNCELYVPKKKSTSLPGTLSYEEFLNKIRNDRKQLRSFSGPIVGECPQNAGSSASLPVQVVANGAYNPSTLIVSHTTKQDSFYRFSPYPNDRRINSATKEIYAGTYLAPESERNFLSSGLAIVGRYALPSSFPAIYMWRVQPPDGTPLRAGTVRSAFGQAGGGVEVILQHNSGANSVYPMKKLPIW